MRTIRRVLVSFLVLAVLVVAAGAVFVSTIDFNDYKETVEAELSAALGRKVRIGGKIEANLLSLTPAVVVREVTVANVEWGTRKTMVRVGRLEVKLGLAALISGGFDIRRLIALEPELFLETDRRGRRNWIFAQAGGESATGTTSGGGGLESLNQLRIERARISYRDGSTGHVDRFGISRLQARMRSRSGPLEFDIEGAVGKRKAKLKGRIASLGDLLAGRAVGLRFTAGLGRSDLAGRLTVQSADRIELKGQLASRRVDTGDFGEARKRRSRWIFGPDPLPVGLLRALSVDLGYKAARVDLGGMPARGVEAKLRIRDGILDVGAIRANVADGKLRGALRLNGATQPPRLKANLRLRGTSLAKLWSSVSGPMNVHLDVVGRGASPRRIASSLNGRVAITGGPGRVANDALVLLTFGVGSIENLLTRGTVRAERVNCVAARFDFANGIGRGRVLVLDSRRLTFRGQGIVSLRTEALNLLFVPSTKETGLGDVTVHPVRVTGPIRRPSASVDASAAAKAAGKNLYGAAKRGLNYVGSLVGATSRSRGRGNPCPAALAAASGKAPPAGARPARKRGSRSAPARRKPKGLLQRLNPFD